MIFQLNRLKNSSSFLIFQYEPDSDSDFVKFKEIIRTEWNNISKYRD
jgi:hypothetical protein